MTIDEARRELKNYILDSMSFADEMEEARRLRARAERVTTFFSDAPGGGKNSSRVEDGAILLVLNAEGFSDMIREEEKRLHAVRVAIHRLPNPYRQLLIERHIKGKTLKDVAIKHNKNCSELSRQYKIGVKKYCEIRNRATS